MMKTSTICYCVSLNCILCLNQKENANFIILSVSEKCLKLRKKNNK